MAPKQSTVSVWAHLRNKFLYYSELYGKTSSEFFNDLLTETIDRVEANQPDIPSLVIDDLRRKLAKNIEHLLSEDVHRQIAGIDPMAESVKEEAAHNVAIVVPLLLRSRRRGWAWSRASRLICGALETDLSRQLGSLYDNPLTAAAARMNNLRTTDTIRLYQDTYVILVRHLLALAIVREVPRRFRSLLEREPFR